MSDKKYTINNILKIPKIDNVEKILARIAINGECWEWSGCITTSGYGTIRINNGESSKMYQSHRVMYSIFKKDIDDGIVIDHICKNRKCVNPEHLREVTMAFNCTENSDSPHAKHKAKTHCVRGHEFSKENTLILKNGRKCKECSRINLKNYRSRQFLAKYRGEK